MKTDFARAPLADPQSLTSLLEEFSSAWARGETPHAADWLTPDSPLNADASFAQDLIYEEFCQRLERGETINDQEFCAQFPAHAASLAKLFAVHRQLGLENAVPHREITWPEVGNIFLGFKLEELLGEGSFSRVYLAEDLQLQRQVVVKICRDLGVEATTLAQLNHPHIVRVHSAPTDFTSGFTAICMPYQGRMTLLQVNEQLQGTNRRDLDSDIWHTLAKRTEGIALPRWRARNGSFETAVIHLGIDLADGLAHAHEQGITHGDLKPSNVLLNEHGQGLLLDFNLATDHRRKRGRTGGTLRYMAPEALRVFVNGGTGQAASSAGDVFALAVVLCEVVLGRHPYCKSPVKENSDPPTALARTFLDCQAEFIATQPPLLHLSRRFSKLLYRCLDADPHRRPSASDLRQALKRELHPASRVIRWTQRHPLTAGVLAATSCFLLVGATFSAAQILGERLEPEERTAPAEVIKEENSAEEGIAAFRSQNYSAAEALLRIAVAESPDNAELRRYLGMTRFQLADYLWAQQDFLWLSHHHPNQAPWELSGFCSLKLKQGSGVVLQLLERASDPSPETLNNLGASYLSAGNRLDDAKRCLDQAVARLPNAQAPFVNRIRWATLALGANEWVDLDLLDSDIERALANGPDHFRLQHSISMALGLRLKFDPAVKPRVRQHLLAALELGLPRENVLRDTILVSILQEPDFPQNIVPKQEANRDDFNVHLVPPLPTR